MWSAQSKIRDLVLVVATLFGCWVSAGTHASDDRARRYYDNAQNRYDKGDFSGATVQLKNALQSDPAMLAAHVLLGRAYLGSGQAGPAQEAFEKALKLGVHPSELSLPIAQALFAQDKFKELLDRCTVDSVLASERADILLLRGQAYRQLGDVSAAKEAYDSALVARPDFIPALRSKAEILIHQGMLGEAARLASDAIQRYPSDSKAWLLKGLTSQAIGNTSSAMTEYTKAIELSATNYDARLARAWLLLDQSRSEELEAEIDYLTREGGRDPRAVYLRATYFQSKGDAERTRSALTEITVLLDGSDLDRLKRRAPQFLLIGALAHYQLGRPERARDYLERYVQAEPRNLEARKLLASILLTVGDFSGALQKLQEVEKQTPNDPYMLALIAAAYMGRQRPGLAAQYLEQALSRSGSAPQVQATLGIGLLRAGQVSLGLEHLRKAFDRDPRLNQLGIALTALYIRRQDLKNATEVAEKVTQRAPRNAVALNLLGVARVAAGDRKGARAAYVRAIGVDKAFTPARLNLGKLELAEGKVAVAREIYLAILKERPKDIQAMYELAVLDATQGQLADAARWLEKLRAINQRNITGVLYLVDVYTRMGDKQKALEVAKSLEELVPRDLNVLASLGQAYLNSGDVTRAQEVFSRMAGYADSQPEWQVAIAQYQLLADNVQGAALSLAKAVASKPDFLAAEVLLTETDLRRGQRDAAEVRARAIQRKYPGNPVGDRLIGDVALNAGKYDAALDSYRLALAKEPSTDNALRIFQVYITARNFPAAVQFIENWLREHPRDFMAIRALADGQLRAGDLSAARTRYETILKDQGDDVNVLNNLANILAKQNKPGALEYAQRAFRLDPTNAAVQDTLGWLLALNGESEASLSHLREARLRDPGNPEIRYHLAAALARSGRAREARAELDVALSLGPFEGSEEARRLFAELTN